MLSKLVLLVVSISILGFSLWVTSPTESHKSTQQIAFVATSYNDDIEPQAPPLPQADTDIPDQNLHEDDFIDLETVYGDEPASTIENQTVFQGNSNITDDDTEDNDAGNDGFPDDFSNANFDHYAEAYSHYSETYINEFGERFDTVDYATKE